MRPRFYWFGVDVGFAESVNFMPSRPQLSGPDSFGPSIWNLLFWEGHS